jgi:hypothetical protein
MSRGEKRLNAATHLLLVPIRLQHYALLKHLAGMPKKTSTRKSAKAVKDSTDDDFDQMLAEVMAADLPLADRCRPYSNQQSFH